ncbi:UbiA prenyltransferase family-domain-containing protein [Cladorrhinum sp. PSN332]|nr:UbiA prenyltransferase family-domain-containing protein [Cladorrhinum sp. PSN332]
MSLLPPLQALISFFSLVWGFIESDFLTFAVPHTAYGVFGALSSVPLVVPKDSRSDIPSTAQILGRLPLVLIFNVANLVIVDCANQRNAMTEDKLNKPWRPIPSGRITPDQTRRLMLALMPLVQVLNYLLGAWEQGVLFTVLIWMYNDLGGGDEMIVREILLSVAFAVLNHASLAVAVGPGYSPLCPVGLVWTGICAGVILTTIQVQDLKDQAGDRMRGRKSICLSIGDNFSRTTIAAFVCFWSCVCGYFWDLGLLAFSMLLVVGAVVVLRVLVVRSPRGDAKTWKLWCFWHAVLYALPVLSN